ncbi:hypothetical protein ACTOJ1_001693 [Shigella flexneri]
MKRIIVGILSLLAVSQAGAVTINDAFGVKLGQQVNTSQMKASAGFGGENVNSGPATYQFAPAVNDMKVNFNEYSFSTDNSRRVIASVTAIKNSGSEKQCQADLSVIKEAATKKYGAPSYSQINNVNFVDSQSRSKTVAVSCSQNVLTFVLNDVNSGLQF